MPVDLQALLVAVRFQPLGVNAPLASPLGPPPNTHTPFPYCTPPFLHPFSDLFQAALASAEEHLLAGFLPGWLWGSLVDSQLPLEELPGASRLEQVMLPIPGLWALLIFCSLIHNLPGEHGLSPCSPYKVLCSLGCALCFSVGPGSRKNDSLLLVA